MSAHHPLCRNPWCPGSPNCGRLPEFYEPRCTCVADPWTGPEDGCPVHDPKGAELAEVRSRLNRERAALARARGFARAWKELAKRYRADARERRSACELALRLCEALAEERQARELAERRAELEAQRSTEAARRAFNVSEERVRERDVLLGEFVEAVERFDGFDVDMMGSKGAAEAADRLSMLARLARERYAPFPSVFCHPARSAQVSSAASGFPGRRAPACKERENMSENNGISVSGAGGAEGGTLNTGEPDQPKQARTGRFPKSSCHKLANGASASAGAEDGRDGSSVQRERNETGAQVERRRQELDAAAQRWLNRSALDAARSWARDWLDVYGQPSALWALLMRFAALVAMRPGERRRLDERHAFRLFEAEPGGILEAGQLTVGIVLPFGVERFGRELPEREVLELEALARGAIERAESLHAEAELFRHAAGLIRGREDGSGGWHPGFVDFLNEWGTTLDGPHPDAVSFSLFGALAQAWAERGGAGPVPVGFLARLVEHASPRRGAKKSRELLLAILRDTNHAPHFSRDRALNALIGAALAADAEAEGEVP